MISNIPVWFSRPTPMQLTTTKKIKIPKEREKSTVVHRTYDFAGKRDPFRSFIKAPKVEKTDKPPKLPVQRYNTEQYMVTGILWDMVPPLALVEDPEGIGHVVEIGAYLGNKWGKVQEIKETSIIVVEEITTTDGEIVLRPIELTQQK